MYCADNFVPVVPVTQHETTPSDTEEEATIELLEPFSDSFIDDGAVLVNKVPLAETEAGRDPLARRRTFGCNRCG